ncbi:MAG TPA: polysaccharide deacetylase family protein [Nitrospiria bacterium]|jgi:peptidoglycan/xylan/chitin deacetylase (PgdA/CDA1 family)
MIIPILMYHEIVQKEISVHPYAVSKDKFLRQLDFLKSSGYQTILLEELFQIIKKDGFGPEKKIVITFDDTQLSNYTLALPLLKSYGFSGEFFIATQFIGKGKDLLEENHIKEMAKNQMSIQSHTHTHRFLNDLAPDQIYEELEKSKDILQDITGKKVSFFSCPGGRFTESVLEISKKMGYKAVCVSLPRVKWRSGKFPILGRLIVSENTDFPTFEKMVKLEKKYIIKKEVEYTMKNAIKSLIGNDLYHRLWKLTKDESSQKSREEK